MHVPNSWLIWYLWYSCEIVALLMWQNSSQEAPQRKQSNSTTVLGSVLLLRLDSMAAIAICAVTTLLTGRMLERSWQNLICTLRPSSCCTAGEWQREHNWLDTMSWKSRISLHLASQQMSLSQPCGCQVDVDLLARHSCHFLLPPSLFVYVHHSLGICAMVYIGLCSLESSNWKPNCRWLCNLQK